ncbi:Blp family class II bacteriocin [Carboxylicivirga sp. M1479]|uniref:Blp family class II bacteriocin n=1 Tax=Carboxylicivirga sp. M1479 TaxID=2594476 RepID=UPI0011777F1D|nr:Blp family class II bacteriocin [Carboxylicivirga sp. M1479]TRX72455.1 hypothetical protein FNN09_00525 [Carboxylicivirga sp. M1479]
MKNLNDLGVQELSKKDMKKTDGGGWRGAIAGACLGAMTGNPAGVLIGAIAGAFILD